MHTFNTIKNKRKSELVEDEIRKSVLDGRLRPGERLPAERELAKQMGVGRSVLREALRSLELSGLVDIRQGVNGGIFLKQLDASIMKKSFSDLFCFGLLDIEALSEARLLIEKDIIELVIKKAHKVDFTELDRVIREGFEKIEKGEKIRKENFRFHTLLAELAGNPVFVLIINAIIPITSAFVELLDPPPDHSRYILESHRDILEAIKVRDAERAKRKHEQHVLFFSNEFKKLTPPRDTFFKEAASGADVF